MCIAVCSGRRSPETITFEVLLYFVFNLLYKIMQYLRLISLISELKQCNKVCLFILVVLISVAASPVESSPGKNFNSVYVFISSKVKSCTCVYVEPKI